MKKIIASAVLGMTLLLIVGCDCDNDNGVNGKTKTQVTVNFDTNGGIPETISSVEVDSGGVLGTRYPVNPIKNDYTFDGWFDGTTQYTASTIIVEDVNLVAAWKEILKYTLLVDINDPTVGGSVSPTSQSGINAGVPVDITATAYIGYRFIGWTVTNGTAAFGNANSAATTVTLSSNATIKANFLREFLNPDINYGTFTDLRDDKIYHTVTIGAQTWMAENLNYWGENDEIGLCYNNRPDSCAKYGRLYTWIEAMDGASSSNSNPSGVQGVCPVGWHVPSDIEWTVLTNFVGGSETAGTKLRSQNGWHNVTGVYWQSTDEYGFSAPPGGRTIIGVFESAGNVGSWNSTTEHDAESDILRHMSSGQQYVFRAIWGDKTGYKSVRCVRDVHQ